MTQKLAEKWVREIEIYLLFYVDKCTAGDLQAQNWARDRIETLIDALVRIYGEDEAKWIWHHARFHNLVQTPNMIS